MAHQKEADSSLQSGLLLSDVADIAIDTHAPIADAAVELKTTEQNVAATSTVAAVTVVQLLVGEIAVRLEEMGHDLDIFKSPTAGGSPETNSEVFKIFKKTLQER